MTTIGAGWSIGPGWNMTQGPATPGQQAYTTPGTFSWTAPAGITSVSVVCVGGGGGSGSAVAGVNQTAGVGAQGAVRIIWGGNRAFPATNTGNL